MICLQSNVNEKLEDFLLEHTPIQNEASKMVNGTRSSKNTSKNTSKKPKKFKNVCHQYYLFDDIIGHKYENGQFLYKVKWTGTDQVTFEPLKNFSKTQFVEEYFCAMLSE